MQDIYKQRSNWKIILAVAGLIILLITIIYSNFLARKLADNEAKNSILFTDAIREIQTADDLKSDMSFQTFVVENYALPVIFKQEDGSYEGFNFSEVENLDQAFLKTKVDEFLKSGQEPIQGEGYSKEIFFFNSELLQYIKYFPLVQILLVSFFIGLGYYLFNSSKRAEQNRVWAGMAKETAHQLGTPISAIMGWITHLRESDPQDINHTEIIDELEKDVQRLDLVADRFSKIGSSPELIKANLVDELVEIRDYMKRRSPRKIIFDFPIQGSHESLINKHLFAWVLENLIRNSLDAMDAEGKIKATIYQEEGFNCIDLSDTGKGIPSAKFKTVFQPGYSTKNRGWGLGLSLAKRIIEDYHKGKIFVKSSSPSDGTTFTIKLPLVK